MSAQRTRLPEAAAATYTSVYRQLATLTRYPSYTIGAAILFVAIGLAKQAPAQNAPLPAYLYDVVRYNAPFIIAETKNTTAYADYRMDQILPVDFDGNTIAADNQVNAVNDRVVDTRPTVYFSVAESQGWYFIGYYFYHPWDGGFTVDVLGTDNGHENDLEGVFLMVQKGLWGPYGQPLFALTQAHGAMIPFAWTADGGYLMNNSLVLGDARAYGGEMHFWNNPFSGHDHPVVAIRSSTHGTYMAQDCSDTPGQSSYFYDGSGMWGPKSDPYTFRACYHDDSQWMLLEPAFGYDQEYVAPFGPDSKYGVWDYRLVDLSTSSFWANRLNSSVHGAGLFFGSSQDIGGGQQGLPHFDARNYDPSNTADPMWEWLSGSGSCRWVFGIGGCWYSFHDDATGSFHDRVPWPTLAVGELLMDPANVARKYFPKWSSFPEAMLYNPYPVNAPPPPPPPQLTASISGPSYVAPGQYATWMAVVSNGTPPYTYQWSGAFSGTDTSVSGSLYSDDTLYLDVWDAAGAHVAISQYIPVDPGCHPPNPC